MMKNKNKRNRRPQASKRTVNVGNPEMMQAMQGKRSSNAAGAHRPATAYRRRGKYPTDYRDS